MSTERLGSGRGAKRILRAESGRAEGGGERRRLAVLVGVLDELRLFVDDDDGEWPWGDELFGAVVACCQGCWGSERGRESAPHPTYP